MIRKDWGFAIGISLVALVIYLLTLCPTVYVGDSGELTAAAYTLGIAHPPGYPLLCLAGKIFTWIPLGDIAYRINLLSAVFATSTVVLLYLLLLKIIQNRIIASVGSLIFAFSHTFWNNANIGKSSYAINAFFTVVILLTLYQWSEIKVNRKKEDANSPDDSARYLYLSGLFFGLGLANHHTILFLLPFYLGYIIYYQVRVKDKILRQQSQNKPAKSKNSTPEAISILSRFQILVYFNLLFFFILGLLLYLYLPIRASSNPLINWGIPDSWDRFIAHIARKQYGSMSFNFSASRTAGLFVKQFIVYLKLLVGQFTPFLAIIIPVGIYALFRKTKENRITSIKDVNSVLVAPGYSWLLLGIFLTYSIGLIYLINFRPTTEEITLAHVFFIPGYLISAIWITAGIQFLIQLISQYKTLISRYATWLSLILPLIPLLAHYSNNNRHYIRFGTEYAQTILDSLPQHAILFSIRDSNNFTLAYQIYVEKQRPDITIYDMSGGLFQDASGGYRKDKWQLSEAQQAEYRTRFLNQLLAQNQNQHPIFCEIPIDTTPFPGYGLNHDAYFYRFTAATDTIPGTYQPSQKYHLDSYFNPRKMDSLLSRISDFYIREALVDYHFQLGKYYQETGNLDTAVFHYQTAEKIGMDMSQVHNNIGIAYYLMGKFDLAVKEYEQAIAIDPNNREVYYNLALYYQNIAKNPDFAQFYYNQFQSITK